MDKDTNNLWSRRTNVGKLSLSMDKSDRQDGQTSSRRFGPNSSHGRNNPFNTVTPLSTSGISSPTTGAASGAFALGTGAFASFGSATKTPKTPGTAFDFAKAVVGTSSVTNSAEKKDGDEKKSFARKVAPVTTPRPTTSQSIESAPRGNDSPWPLKYTWVIWYRPPTSKNSDYEKSTRPMCKISTAQQFWQVYSHLKHPSGLPTVSDYHFFRDGIRPVWEDEENKKGGKWILRLKKGVADRYWEDLLMAMIGDQFAEAGEEVCGAVVSVRSGEDVFSIWTKNDGGRNVKIRETIKRVLSLPADTNMVWKSHDDSITQRSAIDQARQEKTGHHGERRRNQNQSSTNNNGTSEEKAAA
ncbi:putative translation initiation factor eIF4E3 [Aureobasidium pullulans]|uniref:Putative translation initiation factor eIF4E3 n=1 Tax=Aureobasidium pullulans TaxID=5580 RepID=A0A4S9UAM7_AURPU|nr:putative translation initiation factor eIF4E3 [Aureobasidium pullulans]THZ34426.1 putative translation initiation factor eIF4E3 [Aureobasidium pullulans]TIA59181.1 putative translation initiation factor eIF4E3 [Aureobasidium pullulans]